MPAYSITRLIWTVIALGTALMLPSSAGTQEYTASRAPFTLEFPALSKERFRRPTITVPISVLEEFRFRVIEAVSGEVPYGSIIVTLNMEGINRSCSKSADSEGKVITCLSAQKQMLGGYRIRPGKNVLEIRAKSRRGAEYYASFVVLVSDDQQKSDIVRNGIAKPERFTGKKFALIVGVSEYSFQDAGLRNLKFADDDAIAFNRFLKSRNGGGFNEKDIRLLINKDASKAALAQAMYEISVRAGPEDLVVIFIAGHGSPDPIAPQNLYFLLSDTKVLDMPNTAFPMSGLKEFVDTRLRAQRVIALIDTCHSGGVNQVERSLIGTRQLIRDTDENNLANRYLAETFYKERGRAVLTSSDVNEVSEERDDLGHGVFTWAVLDGLSGKADRDGNNLITTGELFEFTRTAVRSATNNGQNPIALSGSVMNLTIATLKHP
jgi:hypothetical protein